MSEINEVSITSNNKYVHELYSNDNKVFKNFSSYDLSNSIASIKRDDLSYNNYERTQEVALINILERRIYDLLLEGQNDAVRDLINNYKDLSSPLLDKWRKAFSRSFPKKTVKASLQDNEIANEKEVIHKARKHFISKWIAISSGEVVASNDQLEELKAELLKKDGDITFVKL